MPERAAGFRRDLMPVVYSPELVDRICERLEDGESLLAICRDAGMPSQSTFFRWLEANAEVREKYARARERQAHVVAQQAVDDALIASDAALGRLAFDARRWFAGKLAPKVYGDKQLHAGPDGEGPIQLHVRIIDEGSDAAGSPAASPAGHD
jgi:hypothetical protein